MQKLPDVEILRGSPFSWFDWLLSIMIWMMAGVFICTMLSSRIVSDGGAWAVLMAVGAPALCAGCFQWAILVDRDIVLSVEGVRKGKDEGSIFIPWRGATIRFLHGHFRVSMGKARIEFRNWNFDEARYPQVMDHIWTQMRDQGRERHNSTSQIGTPFYTLSDRDRSMYARYGGNPRLYVTFFALLFVAVCCAYLWIMRVIFTGQPLNPDLERLVQVLLHDFPIIFYTGPLSQVLQAVALNGGGLTALAVVLSAMLTGLRKKARLAWCRGFDRAQVVSVSEAGVQCRDSERHSFYPWADVSSVRARAGLIMFSLIPAAEQSFIVPKRVFPTQEKAAAFYHHAVAYKRASAGRPNLFEPVSFWEIA